MKFNQCRFLGLAYQVLGNHLQNKTIWCFCVNIQPRVAYVEGTSALHNPQLFDKFLHIGLPIGQNIHIVIPHYRWVSWAQNLYFLCYLMEHFLDPNFVPAWRGRFWYLLPKETHKKLHNVNNIDRVR